MMMLKINQTKANQPSTTDGNQLMLEKPVDGDVQLLARLESPVFEVTTDEEFLEIYLKTGPTEQPQLTYERRFRLAR